ncbi:STAS domain-containing protein [Scytonema millei]|uniref:Anti-sigma factor antagonist n=1 Tax=Scytonema millei VB511283 TaxID=1245923 RepID=A0A9X5E8F1_9CYAN|nr:STAS domain-containing protein [Scytonema millei]NHC37059.1 STAS domain-containing protein [Scytonema millei VB511283]
MMQTMTAPRATVIRPNGHFNAANAADFQRYLTAEVTQATQDCIVVNLEQVESMDSAGLMVLVHGLRVAQSLGKSFHLCSVAPSIRIIFELTQLDSVFEILDTPVEVTAA